MSSAQELAQLKDIHMPEPISWWPLAPGWYGLMALGLFLLIALLYWLRHRAQEARLKREALLLLATYKKAYEKDLNAQLACAQLSELLKRVALVYFPRQQVAGLQGKEWIDFLNRTSRGIDFTDLESQLLESPFKAQDTGSISALMSGVERWIKQRRRPC